MDPLFKLEFTNFQSLKKTDLNLHPGLNVIVGPSNLGKSAAIRGLKALVRNAAAPGLIRQDEKEMIVSAAFADGQLIDLTKGKNKSEFRVNDDLYAKAGATSVPEQVAHLWNISDYDLCFASQHDKPFLLDVPASTVATIIGDLTNASMLMEAVQLANKYRTQALNDEKARLREAEEARAELLGHEGINERARTLALARTAYESALEAASDWQAVVQLQEVFRKAEQERKLNTEILKRNLDVDALVFKAEQAVSTVSELERLSNDCKKLLVQRAKEIQARENLECEITTLDNDTAKLLEDAAICPLCEREM